MEGGFEKKAVAAETGDETIEQTDAYQAERKAGFEHAKKLIADLEDFEKMDYREQLASLQEILSTLEEDNGNRFIAEYVAAKMADVEIQGKQAELENDRPLDILREAA